MHACDKIIDQWVVKTRLELDAMNFSFCAAGAVVMKMRRG